MFATVSSCDNGYISFHFIPKLKNAAKILKKNHMCKRARDFFSFYVQLGRFIRN